MQIILCGIVKNEADNIVRTLDSFKPVADKVVLTDTGSTDGTPEIVERWLRDNQVPGVVYRCPWESLAAAAGIPPRADGSPPLFDFARARNVSVSLAMQHSEDPHNDWIFEVDSTWILRGHVAGLKPALEALEPFVTGGARGCTGLEVMVHQAGASSVPYLRLRRVSECGSPGKNWAWRARIHEYLWRPDNAQVGRTESIWIDHDDTEQSAANRLKRLERDVQIFDEEISDMLARGVDKRPMTDHERGELTRSFFYRGQAKEGLGRDAEAYADYEARAKLQGAPQEWATACYRAGRLSERALASAEGQKAFNAVVHSASRWYLESFAVGGRPEGLWAYAAIQRRHSLDPYAADHAALIAYDVAKALKDKPADGFGYADAYALATPGPARNAETIAARIHQLGLLGVPYPAKAGE